MRVTHIKNPFSGERIAAIEPPLNPNVDARWRRRLNLYTGRALSDTALTTEQAGRVGRLAARGQMMSPGVINGLMVGLEGPLVSEHDVRIRKDPEALRDAYFFHISSGAGIMPSGEDVVLPRNIRVAVGHVPVYTTVDNLEKSAPREPSLPAQPIRIPADRLFGVEPTQPGRVIPILADKVVAGAPIRPQPVVPVVADKIAAGDPIGRIHKRPDAPGILGDDQPQPAVLKPRRLGPSLMELTKAGIALPRASILLLQPIVLKRVGEFDDEDPCEQDSQNYAFEDWQLVDGCQLILYTWPTELTDRLPLPEDSPQWRNQLANTIFEAEANSFDPRELLPWEEIGLPIGLIGFDREHMPLFVDRYSVVRGGGKPKRRSTLVPDISDVKEGKESEDFDKINRYTALVPGAGHPFLWQARLQQFAEQMVEAMRLNKSISDAAEQFRILPPAGLLPKEALTVNAGQIQNHFFPIRFEVSAAPVPLEQLDVAINGSASLSVFDTNNPDRLQVLVPIPQTLYEPNLLEVELSDPEFVKNIDTSLRKLGKWIKRRYIMYLIDLAFHRAINGPMALIPEPKLTSREETEIMRSFDAIDQLDTHDDPSDKELSEPEEAFETSGDPPGSTQLDKLRERLKRGDIFPKQILEETRLPEPPSDIIDKLGLKGFIDYLEQKVNQADDIIDFGFVRVQTDIYRYRQLMLGSTEAARLATSPALAAIAKGETALATKEQIIDFIKKTRTTSVTAQTTSKPETSGSEEPPAVPRMMAHASSLARTGSHMAVAADVHTPTREASSAKSTVADLSSSALATLISPPPPATTFDVIGPPPPVKTVTSDSAFITRGQAAATLFSSSVLAAVTPSDITQQTAIVGRPLDFRTVTVAERIKQAPAPEAKDFTVSSKYEVLKALEELAKIIILDDLVLPGFYDYTTRADGSLKLETQDVPTFEQGTGKQISVKMPKEVTAKFQDLRTPSNNLINQVLGGLHDLDPVNGDEPAFFAAAVRASDHTVAILRIVEGRIQAYRNILDDCRKVLGNLIQLEAAVTRRMNVIEGHLAEMRHDLAVGRALKADEDLRVENINRRRAQILNEHVAFLAFRRERTTDLHDTDVKVREVDPAIVESPVPACLARDVSPPPELRAMTDLLRDAPVKWFTNVHPLLDRFDRLESLQRIVSHAKVRANLPPWGVVTSTSVSSSPGFFGSAIGQVIQAQQGVVLQSRLQVARLDLSTFTSQSWQLARDQAREVVSLGDLIDGNHGRSDVSQQAAREAANISHVASCLYAAFSVVLPIIRLNWAERISQFDAAVNLHNLGSLPRWGEVAYLDRREMQTYTDWLFSRIDRQQPEAISLINELVRVCILLASHAPVNQIIAAHIPQKTEVSEGGLVRLTIDPNRVRVGMHVLMYRAGQIAARGIVEDLTSGQAAARVIQVHSTSKTTSLDVDDQVQIAEAGAFDRNPLALVKSR